MSEIQQTVRLPIYQERYDEIRSVSNHNGSTKLAPAIVVGITGTRKGLSPDQERQLRRLLKKIYDLYSSDGEVWLAHGDCIGVDSQAHKIAKELGYKIRRFPPSNSSQRGFCDDADITEKPEIFSIRNHNIVRACDYLIALPRGDNEMMRGSGTWSTMRYARNVARKPYTIIYPNGRMDGKEWQRIFRR
jgi:hypothetical protein